VDHCDIVESKDFFITWTTDLLIFFLNSERKIYFFYFTTFYIL